MHPVQTGSDAAVSVSEFVVSSLPEEQRAGEWPRKTTEMKIKQSFIPKLWAQLNTKQKQNLHPHHWENSVLKEYQVSVHRADGNFGEWEIGTLDDGCEFPTTHVASWQGV